MIKTTGQTILIAGQTVLVTGLTVLALGTGPGGDDLDGRQWADLETGDAAEHSEHLWAGPPASTRPPAPAGPHRPDHPAHRTAMDPFARSHP